jgi:Na+/serine symporter
MSEHVVLSVVLAVAGLCAAGIVGVALAALVQRRSVPYLLVTLALATVLARTVVGVALMWGVFPDATHHTLEHGLDVLMAGLVIAAVYTARQARGVAE